MANRFLFKCGVIKSDGLIDADRFHFFFWTHYNSFAAITLDKKIKTIYPDLADCEHQIVFVDASCKSLKQDEEQLDFVAFDVQSRSSETVAILDHLKSFGEPICMFIRLRNKTDRQPETAAVSVNNSVGRQQTNFVCSNCKKQSQTINEGTDLVMKEITQLSIKAKDDTEDTRLWDLCLLEEDDFK